MINIIVYLIFIIFCIYMLIRNQMVKNYRLKLIDKIFSFKDYKWRNEIYDSVSYDKMMIQFWRRLDSFYPDKSFLKE